METIKIYLETMFASMPDTDEVRKAKAELWSMMEDKYNELIAEGKQKNEAVGTVISEFGNLDELAESLGLKNTRLHADPVGFEVVSNSEVRSELVNNRRIIGIEEAATFVSDIIASRVILGLGIMLCIFAPAGPILGEGFSNLLPFNIISNFFDGIGVALLFVLVALGVGCIILAPSRKKEWKFLNKKSCVLNSDAADFALNGREQGNVTKSMMLSLGIILCVVSIVPVSFFGILGISAFLTAAIGPALIFILSGLGVFFIILSSAKIKAFKRLTALDIV